MEITKIKSKFMEIFGGDSNRTAAGSGSLRVFVSPGRVNLIGEHTDYNGGYVFPAALNMRTAVAARPRADRVVRLAATDLDGIMVIASLDRLDEYKGLSWGNYQLGVADELQKAGYSLTGCDMLYDDTIPHGGGLSSSAAIEVATALALVTLGNEAAGNAGRPVDMIELAKIGQKAENNYVGVNCGIMDQFASAMGKAGHAIFLDCKDLSYRYVPLKLQDLSIVISNTNKKRSLAVSKYNERRSECEQGLKWLQEELPGKCCLGDITYEEFLKYRHLIKDDTVARRVEHVISEDDRVLKSIAALTGDDINEFGRLMNGSHESLRSLYEVTGYELDTLVDEALKIEGVIGSRMTGAGFGGCTVSIVRDAAVAGFIREVGRKYEEKTGIKASFYVTGTGDGGREVK